ncbi:porin family protein [Mucilaginibacter sp. UR6-11]|uniref:porin family protein n=1 Tax=Mucilaginibacter sp. UR6-11 TaxID=1435644 RepID=UPI001E3A1754|nr:porin family protein [Mucilaginibacter sp. UR6-11]MCC8424337.1 PorT family protein [Mucilaginibacter sp. UR6-11]
MRKIILLAVILLGSRVLKAQTYFNGDRAGYNNFYETKFGFEADATISNTTDGTNFTTGNLAGFSLGFNVALPAIEPMSIMPALLYAQKGYTANTPSGTFSQRSQSVDIPVMAKFNTGGRLKFFIGPQVSFILSTSNKFSNSFPVAMRKNYQYSGTNIRYQGVAGAGLDLTRSISIHALYTFDLQRTNKSASNFVPSYRQQALLLGLGFNL